jgi:hypothetical protein
VTVRFEAKGQWNESEKVKWKEETAKRKIRNGNVTSLTVQNGRRTDINPNGKADRERH